MGYVLLPKLLFIRVGPVFGVEFIVFFIELLALLKLCAGYVDDVEYVRKGNRFVRVVGDNPKFTDGVFEYGAI
jgi:uncharacterized membrane protein YoaK (UPF0700 family)